MAFAIDRRGIPSLRSFARCEAHAAKWRAKLTSRSAAVWGNDCLPLHAFKDKAKRLEWLEDSQAWACVYHRSHVVTYYKDGRVLLNATWDSVSTRIFFEELCPEGVWLMPTRYGRAYCIGHAQSRWDKSTYGDDVEWHEVNRNIDDKNDVGQGLLIDEQGVVLNPQPWVTKRTVSDRVRRKEIIAKMKPFLTWYDAMTSIGQSMRGVVAGAEQFEPSSWHAGTVLPVTNKGSTSRLLVLFMEDDPGKDDEMLWRRACWEQFVGCFSRWETIADAQYGPHNIPTVRKKILEIAFKNYDGYKEITKTSPPGEKP